MTRKDLNVLIGGNPAGILSEDSSGSLSFRYLESYRGIPLSSSMPLSTRTYRDKTVLPYLWGLLPEDIPTRRRVAAEAGVSPNNPFALLGVIGLDCPGAVQFCSDNSKAVREERLVSISEGEIARRLSLGRDDDFGWIAQNEHWSLGGQQNKFALRKEGDDWFVCEGAAATTHILKSGVRGLAHQALNEYVCMRLAKLCSIDVADVEYREFRSENGIEPAIVVKRYDRLVDGKSVVRLHQEDFCQALGCLPENKYTMNGGPSSSDILKLLKSSGSSAQENVADFLQMLFFNYLLAATDAHAKNYSLMLHSGGTYRLAPMYDVASIAPYVADSKWIHDAPKLAMSIGGENRVGHLSLSNLRKLVSQCGLDELDITADGCARLIELYADAIPDKLAKVFDELSGTESARAAEELRAKMEEPIARLCARSKEML